MNKLTKSQELQRAAELKKLTRSERNSLDFFEGIDNRKYTSAEIIDHARSEKEFNAKVKAYRTGKTLPNLDAIKRLPKFAMRSSAMNDCAQCPNLAEQSMKVLGSIFDELSGEYWANSGEGRISGSTNRLIDPIDEGFEEETFPTGHVVNARGMWASALKREIQRLFFKAKDDFQENAHNEQFLALCLGVGLMRFAIENPNGELAKMLYQINDNVMKGNAEMPRRVAREVKKRAATRPAAGKPPRYTAKKMGQAFERMHKLINNSGKTQLEAATETIKRMKLDIGARYLTEAYRAWLPTRPQGKKT